MMAMNIQPNLTVEEITSTSAKNVTAQTLIKMMTTQKMVIHAALGTSPVQ
jgi:hypothetical protein